jgi:hypothetical protein
MMLAGIVHVMVRNGTGEDKRLGGEFLLHLSGELGFSGSGRGGGSGFEMGDGCEGRDVKGGKGGDPTFRNGFL